MQMQLFLHAIVIVCAFRIGWACIKLASANYNESDGPVWAMIISIVVNVIAAGVATGFLVGWWNG